MDSDDIGAVARGLEAALALFPAEIAAAIALAQSQRAALAAMLPDAPDAP